MPKDNVRLRLSKSVSQPRKEMILQRRRLLRRSVALPFALLAERQRKRPAEIGFAG